MKNANATYWLCLGLCLLAACGREVHGPDDALSEESKHTVTITKVNFEELVAGEQPLLVDFWAPWCGPCLAQSPIVEKLAEQLQGKVVVAKANVDDLPDLARTFDIKTIPCILIFHDGKETQRFVGVQDRQTLLTAVWELLPKE
jgi:thioredoxin 1